MFSLHPQYFVGVSAIATIIIALVDLVSGYTRQQREHSGTLGVCEAAGRPVTGSNSRVVWILVPKTSRSTSVPAAVNTPLRKPMISDRAP